MDERDISVWFVTPAHQRFALSDVCFAQRRRMLDALPFDAHAVVIADDQNFDLALKHGLTAVEMDNRYVGAKFNAGYQHAVASGATHVMAVGSDSWLHPKVFEGAAWGRDAIGIVGLSSFSPYGDQRIDLGIKYAAGFGVGMVYPSWCLPRDPCTPSAQYGCDNSTWSRCGRGKMKVLFQDYSAYTYCNFHSDDFQITAYESLAKAMNRIVHHERDPDEVFAPLRPLYDADLMDSLTSVFAARGVGAFLRGSTSLPSSTKPVRNPRPTDQRETLGGARAERIRRREVMRAERRARKTVIITVPEYNKFKAGLPYVDVDGLPVDSENVNIRVAHSRKGSIGR